VSVYSSAVDLRVNFEGMGQILCDFIDSFSLTKVFAQWTCDSQWLSVVPTSIFDTSSEIVFVIWSLPLCIFATGT
jgi:hypothetical protein